MKCYYTADMKLAVALATLGVPLRDSDPVTCHIESDPNGIDRKIYTFWFDTTQDAHGDLLKTIVLANKEVRESPDSCALDIEHPFFYIRAALDNRDVFLRWIKQDVAPMRLLKHGKRTLLIGDRASERTKQLMHKALVGDFSPTPNK